MTGSNHTLLFHLGQCQDCWDSTIIYTPHGLKKCAPCLTTKVSPRAERLAECVWLRVEKKKSVEPSVLNVARLLIHATVDTPVSNFTLQGYLRSTEREIKAAVRELRREWLLPIGSSRKAPTGYFWIEAAADFIGWARVYRSQAIDELGTLYKLQRANFPELAGQGSFRFVEAVADELTEALR
jgi:hypothetical protein